MKPGKQFYALTLVLLTLCANYTKAVSYNLWVAGTQVTDANCTNISNSYFSSGYCKYDPSQNILQLNSVSMDMGTSGVGAIVCGIKGLKISLRGMNTITCRNSSAIKFNEAGTNAIYGELGIDTPRLTIHMSGTVGNHVGIFLNPTTRKSTDLYLQNFELVADAPNNNSIALYGYGGQLTLHNMFLSVRSGTTSHSPLDDFSTITLKSCVPYCAVDTEVYLMKYISISGNKFYYDEDGTEVKWNGLRLDIRPSLSVGRYMVDTTQNISSDNSDVYIECLRSGKVDYNSSTKTLTLNNAKIVCPDGIIPGGSGFLGVCNMGVEGLTICVVGKNNSITSGSYYQPSGIHSIRQNIKITSDGYKNNTLSISNLSCGLSVEGADLRLDDVVVNISQTYRAIKGGYLSNLTINRCKMNLSNRDDSEQSAISDFKTCELNNCEITYPSKCVYDDYSFKSDGVNTPKMVINVPTATYPVMVMGKQLNNLNKDSFYVLGMEGTVTYNPATATLNLTNVRLVNDTDYLFGILLSDANTSYTINLSGDNYISTKLNAMASLGYLDIKGDGSLTAKSLAAGVSSIKGLRLAVNGLLKFIGGTYGIYVSDSSPLFVENAGSLSDYNAWGEDVAVHCGSIGFTGMDFYSGQSGTPGCYFDKKDLCVKQNGGVVVNGEKNVDFWIVYATYDLFVGGVQVNSANKLGVGIPYICGENVSPYAVSYNPSNSTLSLGVEGTKEYWGISMDSESGTTSAIKSRIDGLDIKPLSDFYIDMLNSSTVTLDLATTTITGPGQFSISSEDLNAPRRLPSEKFLPDGDTDMSLYGNPSSERQAILVTGGDLTFKDADVNILKPIYSKADTYYESPSGILTVDNSNVSVEGYVRGFKQLKRLNGTRIVEPKGGYYDSSSAYPGMVDKDGKTAYSVEFSKYYIFFYPDVNLDDHVDISDIVAVINTIAGDNKYKSNADVNNDNYINISDVVYIINWIASPPTLGTKQR